MDAPIRTGRGLDIKDFTVKAYLRLIGTAEIQRTERRGPLGSRMSAAKFLYAHAFGAQVERTPKVRSANGMDSVSSTSSIQSTSTFRKEMRPMLEATSAVTTGSIGARDLYTMLNEYERRLILLALEASGWHQRRAASTLGILPTTLSEKMKRLGLRAREVRQPFVPTFADSLTR